MFCLLSNNTMIIDYFPGVFHVLRRLTLVRLGRESVHAAEVQGDVALGVLDVFQADETPGREGSKLFGIVFTLSLSHCTHET